MFCYLILLGMRSDSVLLLNTILGGEFEHGLAHVLPSLVILQSFDASFGLILCTCLELLECIENVRFGMNWDHKLISRVVVNKSDPILIPREYLIGNLVHVRVDELKGVGGAILRGCEWVCMHFASKAWFTYRIGCRFTVNAHPSHQIVLHKRFDVSCVVVRKSAMPECQIEWESGCGPCILNHTLCHAIQKCGIVMIDGYNGEWWSRWARE